MVSGRQHASVAGAEGASSIPLSVTEKRADAPTRDLLDLRTVTDHRVSSNLRRERETQFRKGHVCPRAGLLSSALSADRLPLVWLQTTNATWWLVAILCISITA
eukprot:CAMPEP_0173447844 /NCGR_PEP_ID=MMETSP1357-20121228/39542_1 /TAXON_ID=77926 /ORGANISM="Hemiselmis rufescens, Strain PCC563" /LENGTH=103 /DNA_ID=CAMNT_0014414263 /DNA_START=185 /DNA_END=492 /DNA_ORIENTATION=+